MTEIAAAMIGAFLGLLVGGLCCAAGRPGPPPPPGVLVALPSPRNDGTEPTMPVAGLPTLTEAQFQQQVLELAALTGWTVAHFRTARTKDGRHITPVAADGKGFPDLVLAHPARGLLLFRELKSARGRLTPEQQSWLDDLDAAGADAGVWRPADWDEIETTLTGRAP